MKRWEGTAQFAEAAGSYRECLQKYIQYLVPFQKLLRKKTIWGNVFLLLILSYGSLIPLGREIIPTASALAVPKRSKWNRLGQTFSSEQVLLSRSWSLLCIYSYFEAIKWSNYFQCQLQWQQNIKLLDHIIIMSRRTYSRKSENQPVLAFSIWLLFKNLCLSWLCFSLPPIWLNSDVQYT